MSALDFLGADEQPEVTTADKASAVLDVLKSAYEGYQASEVAKGAPVVDKAKLAAAVAADINVASAITTAQASSNYAKIVPANRRAAAQRKADSDAKAVDAANRAQEQASAALPAQLAGDRAKAAQVALDAARAKLKVAPSESAKALVSAWETVVSRISGGGAAPVGESEESFLDKSVFGVKVKYIGLGAVGLAVAGLVARKVMR